MWIVKSEFECVRCHSLEEAMDYVYTRGISSAEVFLEDNHDVDNLCAGNGIRCLDPSDDECNGANLLPGEGGAK